MAAPDSFPRRRITSSSTPHRWSDAWLHPLTAVGLALCACLFVKLGWTSQTSVAPSSALPMPSSPFHENESAWKNQARKVAQRFLEAPTVDQLLPFTRRAHLYQNVMQQYHASNDPLPLGGTMTEFYYPTQSTNGDRLAMFLFMDSAGKSRPLVVAETAEGIRVDWPSLSGYGELSIKEFLELRPTEATLLHVSAAQADYFNYEFSDRKEFLCLQLQDVNQANHFYGFLSRKLAHQHPEISRLKAVPVRAITNDPHPQGITIRARFPKQARSSNHVEITEFICLGWYLP
jgi:hypothetical protein